MISTYLNKTIYVQLLGIFVKPPLTFTVNMGPGQLNVKKLHKDPILKLNSIDYSQFEVAEYDKLIFG